jgi:hypothetical protein
MVNGQLYSSGLANLASPVVNRVHNITGAHAFRVPLNITSYGSHTVTAVATINGRRRPLMGSFEVSIKYPRGSVSLSYAMILTWAYFCILVGANLCLRCCRLGFEHRTTH